MKCETCVPMPEFPDWCSKCGSQLRTKKEIVEEYSPKCPTCDNPAGIDEDGTGYCAVCRALFEVMPTKTTYINTGSAITKTEKIERTRHRRSMNQKRAAERVRGGLKAPYRPRPSEQTRDNHENSR